MNNNLSCDRIEGLLVGLRRGIVREYEAPIILEWIAACYRQTNAALMNDGRSMDAFKKEVIKRAERLAHLDPRAVEFVCDWRSP